uniref:Uncharacterized protein n=1 Tax=Octopus bimaculoides TaxID=37653 RepID=A0A0L8FXG9_OCTBM
MLSSFVLTLFPPHPAMYRTGYDVGGGSAGRQAEREDRVGGGVGVCKGED